MTPDEPGLLGNLPRSRPGTRSDKRSASSGEPELVKEPAPRKRAAKTASKPAAKPKRAAAKPAPAKPVPQPRPEPVVSKSVPPSPTPLESAVKVAGAGLRVAEGVTREVLRRLPRP